MHGESTARIPLHARDGSIKAYTLVDADDLPMLDEGRWWLLNRGYAMGRPAKKANIILLHRFLMAPPPGLLVDHINHDRLDNRRSNLRVVDKQANCQNRAGGFGKSRFRGVVWDRTGRKWRAQAKLNGRVYHLGYFIDEDEAGRVAAMWRREHMPHSAEDQK